MSTQTNAMSLHEILLSIADSLNKAQTQLRSLPPFDEYGRPNTTYQLPYLDFNLEVVSAFASTQDEGAAETPGIGPDRGPGVPGGDGGGPTPRPSVPSPNVAKSLVKFVPLAPTDYARQGSGKITSVISGRFVAVLPNDGLPQVYVSVKATLVPPPETGPASTTVSYRIVVRLQDATGNPIDGQRVEVNFDRQSSLGINGDEPGTAPVFTSPKDGFTGIGEGNAPGEFATIVRLANADYSLGHTFIFAANSGNLFSSVAISNS